MALVAAVIAVIAVVVLQVGSNSASFTLESGVDIPLPFGAQASNLQGKIMHYGTRGGIDVYQVTYTDGEIDEDLLPDNIYIVHVPSSSDVISAPLDTVMRSIVSGSSNVNYYGYKYSNAAATAEIGALTAARFADRFPAQFFASDKARQEDGQHGNMLAAFEQQREITFLKTDSSTGSVRLESSGALYAFVVNETGGATLSVRRSGICGNNVLDVGEACDDGDTTSGDGCSAQCAVENGYSCTPASPSICTFTGQCGNGEVEGAEECDDNNDDSADGCYHCAVEDGYSCTSASPSVCTEDAAPSDVPLSIKVEALPATGSANVGQQNVTLHRFSAEAGPAQILLKAVMFGAEVGSLGSLDNLSLWRDTNGDGTVDVKVLDKGSTSTSTILVFFGADAAQNRIIDAGETAIFEVRGDIVGGASSTIRLGLKTNLPTYIGGKDIVAQEDLGGISTNGSCLFICDIEVTNDVATTWTVSDPPDEPIICGDGDDEGAEQCDDGSTAPGDGCSADCLIESGYQCNTAQTPNICTPASLCGNEQVDSGEECDDGNTNDDDECSNSCELTTPLPSF